MLQRRSSAAGRTLRSCALDYRIELMRRLVSAALFLCLATALYAQNANVTAIRAARLIDGTGAATITNAVIVVTGNKITAVGSNLAVPADAQVIELGNV